MGADSTLVTAAFKEAQTRAGAMVPNLKPLYDSDRKIGTEPFKAIMGLVEQVAKKDALYEAGRVKQFATFRESVNSMHKKLAEDKLSLSANTIDVIDGAIRDLQDEFEAVNTFGNNDTAENEKARYRIEGELNKLIKGTVNTRAGFITIGKLINSVNVKAVDPNELAAIKLFIEAADNDNDTRVTRSMGKDGAMVYTATDYKTTTKKVFGGMMPEGGKFIVDTGEEIQYGGTKSMNMDAIIKRVLNKLKKECKFGVKPRSSNGKRKETDQY